MQYSDFLAWHIRMGYTYDSGASALGVSRSTYANLLRGTHRDSGTPVQYDRRTALACSALEAGLAPIGADACANLTKDLVGAPGAGRVCAMP